MSKQNTQTGQVCPRCKKKKPEVGHYARDYTNMCSDCFAKAFVASITSQSKPTRGEQ